MKTDFQRTRRRPQLLRLGQAFDGGRPYFSTFAPCAAVLLHRLFIGDDFGSFTRQRNFEKLLHPLLKGRLKSWRTIMRNRQADNTFQTASNQESIMPEVIHYPERRRFQIDH